MGRAGRWGAWAALLAMLTGAGTARARDLGDPAIESEEIRLFEEGRYAEVCPKFEYELRVSPSLHVLIAVARCREALGHGLAAWNAYRDLMVFAEREPGREAIREAARQRAEKIRAGLVELLLDVVPGFPADAGVLVDGEAVERSAWGSRMLLDPGRHTIAVRSRGGAVSAVEVTLAAGARTAHIAAPPAEAGPAAAPYVLAGVGVLGLGTAGVIAGVGRSGGGTYAGAAVAAGIGGGALVAAAILGLKAQPVPVGPIQVSASGMGLSGSF